MDVISGLIDKILKVFDGDFITLLFVIVAFVVACKVLNKILKLVSSIIGILLLAIRIFGTEWIFNLI